MNNKNRGVGVVLFLIIVIASFGAAIWFYETYSPKSDCPPYRPSSAWCPQ